MSDDNILSVDHLTMRFGGIVAVNDLSFTAGRRKVTALIGPNGAGKAAEHRAGGECRELGGGGVDAERAAGDFVLAQRLPCAADRQPPQPDRHPVGQERERQDHIEQEHDAVRR